MGSRARWVPSVALLAVPISVPALPSAALLLLVVWLRARRLGRPASVVLPVRLPGSLLLRLLHLRMSRAAAAEAAGAVLLLGVAAVLLLGTYPVPLRPALTLHMAMLLPLMTWAWV